MKIKILKNKMWGMRKLAKMKLGYPVSTSYMKLQFIINNGRKDRR
jgi:hypothetical protein